MKNFELISIPENDHEVSAEMAQLVALNHLQTEQNASGKIKEIVIVKDDNNNRAFYAINFASTGFVLVPAINRETPVLGYANSGEFIPEQITEGFLFTVERLITHIQELREKENFIASKLIKSEWNNIFSPSSFSSKEISVIEDGLQPCIGPLLSTTWGQGKGYNDYIPKECSHHSGGKAPTGCVAVAGAQVMKYWQYPKGCYDWAKMKNTEGTHETAKLMADIGKHVGMHYSCKESTAETKKLQAMFLNNYDYAQGILYKHLDDNGITEQELKEQFNKEYSFQGDSKYAPVVMRGRTKHGTGHAWVCDGYKISNKSGRLLFHMNYGHVGTDNFYVVSTIIYKHLEVMYNIHP